MRFSPIALAATAMITVATPIAAAPPRADTTVTVVMADRHFHPRVIRLNRGQPYRILLVNQTNAAQNGPYIVGAVTANLAPLVRPPDWNSGSVVVSPQTFEVSEGTTWSLSTWKVTTTGNVTVDTTNVAIFPRVAFHGNIANLSANGNVTGLWLVANAATVAIAVSVTTANAPVRTSVINATAGVGGTGYVTFVPGVANDSGNALVCNW